MNMNEIVKKRQKKRKDEKIYQVKEDTSKPKFYVLDMFPYPSGAGLHVGHPKWYIASDVLSRKKILEGFNVLHPMGFDTFGLGTENYAIQNKTTPQKASADNIQIFKDQLEKFGFTYDWSREVNTADPKYHKWTQWIFLKMYTSYFDENEGKAKPIEELEKKLEWEWKTQSEIEKYLDSQRLAYIDYKPINRCSNCKTGLANEDLDDGKCERCAGEVEQKPMKQWVLRITKYAERLIEWLEDLDWEESMKELERNWIGKSVGTQFEMKIQDSQSSFEVYTTRVDTVFGMSFVVMAPEHVLVDEITTPEYADAVKQYQEQAKHKTQLERTELQKDKTGQFTGSYAINPFNNEQVPIYIGDYVLANYGTGVVMAVPAHDERDFEFAKKYDIKITQSIAPENKFRSIIVSETLLDIEKIKDLFRNNGFVFDIVKSKISNREHIRLEFLSNQINNFIDIVKWNLKNKCWIEVLWTKNCIITNESVNYDFLSDSEQWYHQFCEREPLVCGQKNLWSLLAKNDFFYPLICYTEKWVLVNSGEFTGLESDEAIAKMQERLAENNLWGKKTNYKIQDWVFSRQRYWGEPFPVLFDENGKVVPMKEEDLPLELPKVENYAPTGTEEWPLANIDEWINYKDPTTWKVYKRESNTMPWWAGSSRYWMRYMDPTNENALISKEADEYWENVDVYVGGAEHVTRHMIYARFWQNFMYDLGVVSKKEPFKKYQKVGLIMAEDGRKMSKRRGNVVNPDDVIAEHGTDALRVYEMFMGPFNQAIDWNTSWVKGVKKFLDKIILLREKMLDDNIDTDETLHLLHITIKKVTENVDNFGFNTAISQLMILVNHLVAQETISKDSYEKLIILLSPFAPHTAEELWEQIGNGFSIFTQGKRPKYEEKYLTQSTVKIAVQFNGKVRWTLQVDVNINQDGFIELVKKDEHLSKYFPESPKKIIFIPGKICNIVG